MFMYGRIFIYIYICVSNRLPVAFNAHRLTRVRVRIGNAMLKMTAGAHVYLCSAHIVSIDTSTWRGGSMIESLTKIFLYLK